MSTAYRKRRKRIRDLKKALPLKDLDGSNLIVMINPKRFTQLQADWDREVTGPPIGTLQDLVEARA